MSELSYLSAARYGKDKVRVLRVVRDGAWHNIVEYNVTALVEGEIDVRYVFRPLPSSHCDDDLARMSQLYQSRQLCNRRDRFQYVHS